MNKYSVLLEGEDEGGAKFASNTICTTVGEILDAVMNCMEWKATATVNQIDPVLDRQEK